MKSYRGRWISINAGCFFHLVLLHVTHLSLEKLYELKEYLEKRHNLSILYCQLAIQNALAFYKDDMFFIKEEGNIYRGNDRNIEYVIKMHQNEVPEDIIKTLHADIKKFLINNKKFREREVDHE